MRYGTSMSWCAKVTSLVCAKARAARHGQRGSAASHVRQAVQSVMGHRRNSLSCDRSGTAACAAPAASDCARRLGAARRASARAGMEPARGVPAAGTRSRAPRADRCDSVRRARRGAARARRAPARARRPPGRARGCRPRSAPAAIDDSRSRKNGHGSAAGHEEHVAGLDQHAVAARRSDELGGIEPGRRAHPDRAAALRQLERELRQVLAQRLRRPAPAAPASPG